MYNVWVNGKSERRVTSGPLNPITCQLVFFFSFTQYISFYTICIQVLNVHFECRIIANCASRYWHTHVVRRWLAFISNVNLHSAQHVSCILCSCWCTNVDLVSLHLKCKFLLLIKQAGSRQTCIVSSWVQIVFLKNCIHKIIIWFENNFFKLYAIHAKSSGLSFSISTPIIQSLFVIYGLTSWAQRMNGWLCCADLNMLQLALHSN